ncbi:MAG: HsdR family type I site-specific deoxyribonuclease [Synergistaceae bacterium]|nr:HsdR family type I site-specific deoxyribonuclease [Synergistaceae bacterium]
METERQLQNRVKHWLIDDLHYEFIGNRQDINNTSIIAEYLTGNLHSRGYSHEVIRQAAEILDRAAANQSSSLYQANEKVYNLLRYGVSVKDNNGEYIHVNYIDWEDIANNRFYLAEEVTVSMKERKRPDLVLYVNGIALAMIELKSSRVSVNEGIRQMIRNQSSECIQGFFNTMQLLIAGNGSQGLMYGAVETPEKYYLSWKEDTNAQDTLSKKIRSEQSREKDILRDGLVSLCQHERLLSLIHDFIIFDAGVKKIARHNQYFAVIAAQARILQGKGGIIWNTQGSGKSLIMVWLAKWIREHIDDSRVVIITDREELDSQIEGVFHASGEKNIRRAQSGRDLRNILNNNIDPIICSLIHKYGHSSGKGSDIELYVQQLLKNLPKNYEAKGNIIAFIDECHRTNSGKLHQAMRRLMPNAVFIGFTGTPLLKADKPTSLATFGSYIHTYKFNEAVDDGVVVDLRYEARDVNQFISNSTKIDELFDSKTRELTERAKNELKQRWATISKLYSSKERLERIAGDIIYDMSTKPRLASERGNAMLVAGSIYEACKYWEIFQSKGFTKCAVVTSYEPSEKSVRTAASDTSQQGEEEYKKKVYERMLKGKSAKDFETDSKKTFKETPAQMKLLIVVDKLLTGFDAPHATYLYIDKSMRDHDLFQAICRVNRKDGDDKDYGYIVDYMDLFRNIESAIKDYTSGALDGYDPNEIEGFLRNFYDEAVSEMNASLQALKELLSEVRKHSTDSQYIEYFCSSEGNEDDKDDKDDKEKEEKELRRDNLYRFTSSATRSFANCCDRLKSHYNYTEGQVNKLSSEIQNYNRIKELIRLASHDYIDLKGYDADMRQILDTYVHADESKLVSRLSDMSLVELLVDSKDLTPDDIMKELDCDDTAKPEVIENNIAHEIVLRKKTNPAYYENLSEMLQTLIKRRKSEALDYSQYLIEVVEIARKVLHPEKEKIYPKSIRDSSARRAIYDYLNGDEALTLKLDEAVRAGKEDGFKQNHQKAQKLRKYINTALLESGMSQDEAVNKTEEIFALVKEQAEYDH